MYIFCRQLLCYCTSFLWANLQYSFIVKISKNKACSVYGCIQDPRVREEIYMKRLRRRNEVNQKWNIASRGVKSTQFFTRGRETDAKKDL